MRPIYVGFSQREGTVRPLPYSENTRSQALVEESAERGGRAGGKSTIASMLPHLIQGLILLGQIALQQDDAVTACSLLEASATLATQMEEGLDYAELFSLLAWVADLPRNGTGVGVLPWERPMDSRKGHDAKVIASGLVEGGRSVASMGRAGMCALPTRKLRLVPTHRHSRNKTLPRKGQDLLDVEVQARMARSEHMRRRRYHYAGVPEKATGGIP